MTDAITEAMQRAQAVPQPTQVETSAPQTPAVYTGNAAPARPRSLQDAINSAGAAADGWLSTKGQEGFKLDKKKLDNKTIKVSIVLKDVKFGFGVRFTAPGSGTTYLKSYDGVSEARSGKNWQAEIVKAQNADGNCKGQYDLADIPMTLLEDLKTTGKDPISLEAGKVIGHTTPVTGYRPFMAWVNRVMPIHGDSVAIEAELYLEEKVGGGQTYDIIAIREPTKK